MLTASVAVSLVANAVKGRLIVTSYASGTVTSLKSNSGLAIVIVIFSVPEEVEPKRATMLFDESKVYR